MKFEIKGIAYADLKVYLDDLVMNHALETYRLMKEHGNLPGYWLTLTVNKQSWLKTWRDTGNEIKDTKDCLEKSFTEELQGMGYEHFKITLIEENK